MERVQVVGFPESGGVWIRKICNHLLGDSVKSGISFMPPTEKYGHPFELNFDLLITPLRNYKECLPRSASHRKPASLLRKEHHTAWSWGGYIENLKYFDEQDISKLLVCYEDLVESPVVSIISIANFLGASKERLESFLKEYDRHIEADCEGQSMTTEQEHAFDNYIKEKEPELFDKYLKRYLT